MTLQSGYTLESPPQEVLLEDSGDPVLAAFVDTAASIDDGVDRSPRRFPKDKWPLRLVSMSGPEAVEEIREARAHLCVVATETPPADLMVTALRSVAQHVVVPRSHRFAKRRSVRAADLRDEPIVVAPAGSPHRMMLQQLMRASGSDLNVAVEATGWELMLQFARYRVGLAVVNDFCPVPKGMVGIPLEGAPEVTYYLVVREGLISNGTLAMRDLIAETVPSACSSTRERRAEWQAHWLTK